MIKSDIAPFFPKADQLEIVYSIFDKDENGDVSLEEIEMACLEVRLWSRLVVRAKEGSLIVAPSLTNSDSPRKTKFSKLHAGS